MEQYVYQLIISCLHSLLEKHRDELLSSVGLLIDQLDKQF